MNRLLLLLGLSISLLSFSQNFPGPVGDTTTTAVFKTDPRVDYWLTDSIVIHRGYQDISNPTLGNVTYGEPHFALGSSDPQVVSLGDGGIAIYTLNTPISNREGFDFAVFENSFDNHFLELAFVEVSTNGTDYVRFVNQSNTDNEIQTGGFSATNTTFVNNYAGKYKGQYGTPFDLAELEDSLSVDIEDINYIKIIDVVGSINPLYASYDSYGNIINDPWPTPFNSSGFDLDAVAVLKPSVLSLSEQNINFYFNTITKELMFPKQVDRIEIINQLGKPIAQYSQLSNLNLGALHSGLYFLKCSVNSYSQVIKIYID